MCNNRCVFCVSGQRTAMREAFPIEAEPVLEKLRARPDKAAPRPVAAKPAGPTVIRR